MSDLGSEELEEEGENDLGVRAPVVGGSPDAPPEEAGHSPPAAGPRTGTRWPRGLEVGGER